MTSEQADAVPRPVRGLDVCPNCGERAYGIYQKDPMLQAAAAAGNGIANGVLDLASRLFRKRP
jgi:hypothetical protein